MLEFMHFLNFSKVAGEKKSHTVPKGKYIFCHTDLCLYQMKHSFFAPICPKKDGTAISKTWVEILLGKMSWKYKFDPIDLTFKPFFAMKK